MGSPDATVGQGRLVFPQGLFAEQDEAHQRDLGVGLEVVACGREGDAGCLGDGDSRRPRC